MNNLNKYTTESELVDLLKIISNSIDKFNERLNKIEERLNKIEIPSKYVVPDNIASYYEDH